MRVWREGDRIRRDDGVGYGDRVPDEAILGHARDAALGDHETREFAYRVLALREQERGQQAVGPGAGPGDAVVMHAPPVSEGGGGTYLPCCGKPLEVGDVCGPVYDCEGRARPPLALVPGDGGG